MAGVWLPRVGFVAGLYVLVGPVVSGKNPGTMKKAIHLGLNAWF